MQKILTIYNFNFPFFWKDFEKVKYISILEDLEKLFLYSEIFISKEIKNNSTFEIIIFELKNYKVELIFYKKNELYFIPKIEFNFYESPPLIPPLSGEGRKKEEKKQKKRFLLKNILEIFISSWKYNYIFDFDTKYFNYENDEILTIKILKKSFRKYNYNFLQNFFKNTNKNYLQDFLMVNKILRNSFYYLIFLCFKNYTIILKTKFWEKEIEKLLKQKNLEEYNSHLELQKNRLKILEKNILENFVLYKNMLDKIFKIFK